MNTFDAGKKILKMRRPGANRPMGGRSRRVGTAKLYRMNQTRKVTRRPDKRGLQRRRQIENRYKNARRQGVCSLPVNV